MKKLLLMISVACGSLAVAAQAPKTELYDLVKKLLTDSTGYESIGDWGVGQPKNFPLNGKQTELR